MLGAALVFVASLLQEAVHDFTLFEDEVLPVWLDRFTVDYGAGQFAYEPTRVPSLYGSLDVIHVLSTTGVPVSYTHLTLPTICSV